MFSNCLQFCVEQSKRKNITANKIEEEIQTSNIEQSDPSSFDEPVIYII